MPDRPEVGERQHRDSWLDAESTNDPAGRIRNLRELLGGRIDVYGGVSAKDNVFVEDEHVQTADYLSFRMRTDHLKCGPNRLRVMHVDSGEESVGVSQRDHHGPEI